MAKEKKKKVPPQIVKETYICPICRKEHNIDDLCPQILEVSDSAEAKKEYYFWGNVLYQCIEKNINFFDILYELNYVYRFYYDRYLKIYDAYRNQHYNDYNLPVPMELTIDFLTEKLNCSVHDLFVENSICSESLISMLDLPKYGWETKPFRWKNEDESQNAIAIFNSFSDFKTLNSMLFACKYDEMYYLQNDSYSNHIMILRKENHGKYTYDLRFVYDDCFIGIQNVTKKLYYDDNSVAKKRNRGFFVQLGVESIVDGLPLFETDNSIIADIFEEAFDWTVIAHDKDYTDSSFDHLLATLSNYSRHDRIVWEREDADDMFSDNKKFDIYKGYIGEQAIVIKIHHESQDLEGVYIRNSKYEVVVYVPMSNEKEQQIIRSYSSEEFDYHRYDDAFKKAREIKSENQVKFNQQVNPVLLIIDECIERANSNTKQNLGRLAPKVVGEADVMVLVHSSFCKYYTHTISPYRGLVKVKTPDGQTIEQDVYVGYCKQCDYFMMFRKDFNELSELGELLCDVRMVDKDGFYPDTRRGKQSFTYSSQSILNKLGYNVDRLQGLSDAQRKKILVNAISSKKISGHDILDYLHWLVRLHNGQTKYQAAVTKWSKDIQAVEDYLKKLSGTGVVKIRKIY